MAEGSFKAAPEIEQALSQIGLGIPGTIGIVAEPRLDSTTSRS
jgi:hypothetical protein